MHPFTLPLTIALGAPDTGGVSGLLGISPPVLFFFLGVLATLVRSNIAIPKAVTKLLSLYLLWAIGFRGGVELAAAGFTTEGAKAVGLAIGLALLTPVLAYLLLRRFVDHFNAAALAGCYGSVSVVTFLTACAALDQSGTPFGGHMVAAMALMEAPAIVIALLMLRIDERRAQARGVGVGTAAGTGTAAAPAPKPRRSWGALLHEALLNGPILLLLGSLAIGVLTGERGYAAFKPLCTDVFAGVLAFFLLDLGLIAARRLPQVLRAPLALPIFAIVAPLVFAALAITAARVIGIAPGDTVLLAILAASASYIAAPAALRLAIPRADPALYISLALGVTFPFNIVVGIPLYSAVVRWLW